MHSMSGARGVATLIKKSLPLHVKQVRAEKRGCYGAVNGEWEGEEILLINIYAPPGFQMVILQEIGELLVEMPIALQFGARHA